MDIPLFAAGALYPLKYSTERSITYIVVFANRARWAVRIKKAACIRCKRPMLFWLPCAEAIRNLLMNPTSELMGTLSAAKDFKIQ